MGVPGIYTNLDPGAPKTEMAKKGELPIAFSKAWIKSPQLLGGQAPIMKYNRDLMMAILWDRMPYLAEVVNTEVITLEDAPEAYMVFSDGSRKKFVIDPHGSIKNGRTALPIRNYGNSFLGVRLSLLLRIVPSCSCTTYGLLPISCVMWT
jgi:hypothetical protein